VQYLKPAVRSLGERARTKFASTVRSDLANLQVLDLNTYHKAMAHLDPADKQWIGHHHCLGTWTDAKKLLVDPLHDGSCDYCGHLSADFIHLCWTCPFFKDVRYLGDSKLADIDINHLPRHLLLGLPAEFGALYSPTVCNLCGSDDDITQHMTTRHPLYLHVDIHPKATALLEQHKDLWKDMTARQVMDRLRTEHTTSNLPIGLPCVGDFEAPELPNVWTDGAKTVPTHHQWSLAAYGIWHPTRDATDAQPLESCTGSLVTNSYTKDRLAIAGVLKGCRSSSTRAEIAAGLSAVTAPGPIHIGTDSKAFTIKLQAMLNAHPEPPRKPLNLHKDGDLWEAIQHTINAKGPLAIKISWFKGHAKLQHLLDGSATPSSLLHNHIADSVADLGNEQGWWHEGTLELSK
jgi:hypothetical protein